MGVEIERKFLLSSGEWRDSAPEGLRLRQGYFSGIGPTVRVRVAGENAYLTVKGTQDNLSRSEYEYEIPHSDADAMLEEFCADRIVDKIRYKVPADSGLYWEIDEYLGRNTGLFTAEIELPTPETEFEIPAWLGEEVSDDRRYSNKSLSVIPYSLWEDKD